MKKMLLTAGIFLSHFFSVTNVFAQDTLFHASNPNDVFISQGNLLEFVLNTPLCKKYAVSEIGIRTHSSSVAGNIKIGLYKAGTLVFQTDAIPVSAGAGYYSTAIPANEGSYNVNDEIGVVVIASDPAIAFERETDFSGGISGEIPNTNTGVFVTSGNYPNIPSSFMPTVSWYGLLGMTIKGSFIPFEISTSENSGLTNDGTICEGSEATITTNAPSFLNFAWSNGDNSYSTNVTPTTTTEYTVTVFYNSCENTVSTTVTVLPLPSASTTTNNFTISANATGATYQWINCSTNQAISGETNQSFTATSNGSYAVIVTQNGCSDTSECVSFNTIGLEENNLQLSLYPNPANEKLNVEAGETISKIVIYDITGKQIVEQSIQANSAIISVDNLTKGMYTLQVFGAQKSNTLRFIKE